MLIINLVAISSGGGLQNTLSFLNLFSTAKSSPKKYLIVCTEGGPVEKLCLQKNLNHKTIAPGILSRILYESALGSRIIKNHKGKVIFSLFGGAPIFSPNTYKISGFAYSNIIQKEIPFWSFLPPMGKLRKKIIDSFRYRLACQADEIIVETEYLAERARTGVFKGKRIHVIKMAPSTVVLSSLIATRAKRHHPSNPTIDILYLSGAHPNKRIHLLSDTFAELNKSGLKYRLITTLPENTPYTNTTKEAFNRTNEIGTLKNIGPVSPEKVGELINSVDAMANTALLESFSNNWVEAWAADIPLITTDADWAKHSCGDAAIYIDLANPKEAAQRISSVFESPKNLQQIKNKGKEQLKSLPTPEERFSSYMRIINDALLNNG